MNSTVQATVEEQKDWNMALRADLSNEQAQETTTVLTQHLVLT